MGESPASAATLSEIASCLDVVDASDVIALAEVRNMLAFAAAEKPVCDRIALATLAERALASLDRVLAGTAKRPEAALDKAVKLLRAASSEASSPPIPAPEKSAPRLSSLPRPRVPAFEEEPATGAIELLSIAPSTGAADASVTERPPAEASEAAPPSVSLSSIALVSLTAPSTPPSLEPERSPPTEARAPKAPPREASTTEEPFDPELAQEFVAEARQYLEGAEAALLRLESSPGDAESIATVFRCFHTIKGVSAFLGLSTVTTLAHEAECLLSRMRDGEIRCSGGYASLALSSIDALKGLLAEVANGRAPASTPAIESLGARLMQPEAHGIGAESPARAAEVPARAANVAPTPEATTGAQGRTDAQQDTWIRVRTDRLDRLIDMVGELVIAQSMVSEGTTGLAHAQDSLHRKIGHASKIIRELQDLSMSLRMVPLRQTFQKVARVVRDVAKKSGRPVQFSTDGDDTEIDRNMVDVIADPLVHMARNAVDHGLEPSADERRASGKSPQGAVRLVATRSGGEVVLQLSDDGRGIDPERVAKKAIERGLIASTAGMSEAEILNLIFEPGFSTRDEVTDISGRGVGMDVVKRGVEALKGRIEIASKIGEGTTFSLRLPLTLAITDGMLVRVGTERYVIPSVGIRMSLRPDRSALSTLAERGEFLRLRGELVPICRLHHLFDVTGAEEDPTSALLVVVDDGASSAALLVDEVLGQQQVVTKSLGAFWGQLPGIAGGAILGDGRVGLILDVAGVAAIARQRGSYSRPRAHFPSFELS